jgi:peptide chain release factor subunit 1
LTQQEAKERTSVERYMLKQAIERLESKRSFNMSTSLISLYIPPGTRIPDITSQLKDEYGTATNIKDKSTGKAIQSAISSILSRMKNIPNAGDNGLVIFCGITQSNKVEYYAITPPEPVGIKLYRCDHIFLVEHLKEILETKRRYGLVIVARGSSTIAAVQGSKIDIIWDEDSFVPGKHRMGGQSAQRFARAREEAAKQWYSKVARNMNEIYLESDPVEAIIVGGPALSKGEFLESKEIDYRIKEKVIGTYDVGYSGLQGVRELLERASDQLSDFEIVKEKELMERFMEQLGKETGLATYGEKFVKEALDKGAVEIILASEDVDRVNMEIKCNGCEYSTTESVKTKDYNDFVKKLSDRKCPQCSNSKLYIESESDLITELNEQAENTGATLEVISTDHEEGAMLFSVFGGIAAILRYKLFDGY